jgi:hypothetical protein
MDTSDTHFWKPITDAMFVSIRRVPMYIALGEFDFAQMPISPGLLTGLNNCLSSSPELRGQLLAGQQTHNSNSIQLFGSVRSWEIRK